MRQTSARIWSPQQQAIFSYAIDETGNLVVVARAGTGKTTTIVEMVIRYLAAHPGRRIVVCAFNTRIKDELVTRFVGHPVDVMTLHGMGNQAVKRYWSGVRINDKRKDPISRADDLTNRVCGQSVPDTLKRLISKLHTLARETAPLARHAAELVDLAENFELVPDEQWSEQGWTTERLCGYAIKAMELAAAEKPVRTGIDFADMIFLPIRNGWLFGWADLVIVDEAQDMTVAQLLIARGTVKKNGGRMIVVGDDRQAIYGFRGADSGSLARLRAELNAHQLGLTVTYRCGRAIVDVAAQMVPDFQAGPSNPEGEVLGMAIERAVEMAQLGDFVLSRSNAPLIATAMKLLRAGKRTIVAGKKDLGDGLCSLVKKLAKSSRSVPEFLTRLDGWTDREVTRAKAGKNANAVEARIEEILDRADVLRNLADDARSVTEITDRIEALFTDNGLGAAGVITCSSVHKSKGLEADRVFILADTLRAGDIEEENIRYVAVTRAKQSLVWVGANYAEAAAA